MRRALVVVLMGLSAHTANAADDGRFMILGGHGTDSCGAYSAARTNKADGHYATWLTGFLTGYNVYVPGFNILDGTDIDGALGWLDNYCKGSPTTRFVNAANALVRFLEPTAAKTAPR